MYNLQVHTTLVDMIVQTTQWDSGPHDLPPHVNQTVNAMPATQKGAHQL